MTGFMISLVIATSTVGVEVEEARTIGRKIWMIVEAIQRHHISNPDPQVLWQAIVPSIGTRQELANPDSLIAEFVQTRTASECGDLLARRFEEGKSGDVPLSKLLEAILKSLEKPHGTMSLQRSKDYVVEEQLRNNRYVGLGVQYSIDQPSGYSMFGRILPGGSADRGGLHDGTIVMEVDGKSTRNVSMETVLDWLRGPIGTEVTLKIAAQLPQPEREVTLTRGVIRTDSVLGYQHEATSRGISHPSHPTIGWLKIPAISASTLHELRVVDGMVRQRGIRAMVLDFSMTRRGGNFHQAKLVADGLLEGSPIWSYQERNSQPRREVADSDSLFRGIPLVIIVGEWTSGDQAAIAASLQDAGRATIVGESPRYQGEVSTGVVIDENTILNMATARILRTRSDRDWPLVPDVRTASLAELAAQQRTLTVHKLNLINGNNPPVSALFPVNAIRRGFGWQDLVENMALNTAVKLSAAGSSMP